MESARHTEMENEIKKRSVVNVFSCLSNLERLLSQRNQYAKMFSQSLSESNDRLCLEAIDLINDKISTILSLPKPNPQ